MAVPATARAHLETLLREHRLDRTLTTLLPQLHPDDDRAFAQTRIPALDARLGGGLVRGHLSEVAGPRSSGRAALVVATLAAAAGRGEAVALVDPLDQFDPSSAAAAGFDLSRLLWVRGAPASQSGARVGLAREWSDGHRAVERALKAVSLVLQAGNFGVVALDLAEVPSAVVRRVPFTTWLRLQRGIEGSQTVCLLATAEPIARSTLGATIHLVPGVRRQPPSLGGATSAPSFGAPRASGVRQFSSRAIAARVIQPRRTRTEADTELTMAPVIEC